jgi:hypothetical protein
VEEATVSDEREDGRKAGRSAEAPIARKRSATRPKSAARPRASLDRLRPRAGTLIALGLAGVAAVLAWADPFAKPEDGVLLVNNRSGGRRVFPTLVDADPSKATIELQAPDGPVVRIVPSSEGGHQLMHGDVVLGPVADEDFEGLWSSLRLATAQRTADKGERVGQAGIIRISLPDENLTLSLGDSVPGSGVYGVFEAEGDTWVVEAEMLTLVQQPPKSWLSKRLLPIEVEQVTGLAWGDELVLGRGNDGFWRVRAGAMPALLSTEAVEFRLRRLLRAQLDPLVEREEVATESLRPWLVVTTADSSTRAVQVGGACPGRPERRLVDRGPGLLGCVPAQMLERWPLLSPEAGMLEERLVPHDYGRIVGVDLEQPAERKLMRRGGEWFYADGDEGVEAVAEEEVRRWYQNLGRLEVALLTAEPASGGTGPTPGVEPGGEGEGEGEGGEPGVAPPRLSFEPDWTLVVHADSGESLRVRCVLDGDPAICVRDEGPVLRVLGELPRNLVFDAETFAARRLTEIAPGEVRQLEILPAEPEAPTVRQSVHADMGVWALDAPPHPDDNGAIDTVRLENLLWAARSLRAEAWVEPPVTAPLRRILLEVVPSQGLRHSVEIVLYPECIVSVAGQHPAAISEAQCAALGEDLLFDDPLRFWLERSRGVEITRAADDTRVFLRRRDGQFVTQSGAPLEDEELKQRLQGWIDWRTQGIRPGEPPGAVQWTLDVRRDFGPAAQVEIGEGWARLRGADWYYLEREPDPGAEVPGVPGEELDPGAVELD